MNLLCCHWKTDSCALPFVSKRQPFGSNNLLFICLSHQELVQGMSTTWLIGICKEILVSDEATVTWHILTIQSVPKNYSVLDVVGHACNQCSGGRQENGRKFEGSLVYRVSSRPARDTPQDPVWKPRKKLNVNHISMSALLCHHLKCILLFTKMR